MLLLRFSRVVTVDSLAQYISRKGQYSFHKGRDRANQASAGRQTSLRFEPISASGV